MVYIHLQTSVTLIDAYSTAFNGTLHAIISIEFTSIHIPCLHSLIPKVLHSMTLCIQSFSLESHSFTHKGYIHWHLKCFIQWHSAYIHCCCVYILLHTRVTFIDTSSASFNDILHTFISIEFTFIDPHGSHSLILKVPHSMTFCIHSFLSCLHSFTFRDLIHWH